MKFFKSHTTISSYPNKDISFQFDVDKQKFDCKTLISELQNVFKNKAGKLDFEIPENTLFKSVKVKGIVFWDDVPVSNLSFNFDKSEKYVLSINADYFTFRGSDEAFEECDKREHKENYPEILFEKPRINIAEKSFGLHHINTEKIFMVTNNDVSIIMNIRPFFWEYYYEKHSALYSNHRIGIPIIMKTGNSFSMYDLVCSEVPDDYSCFLTQVDKKTWEIKNRPIFIYFYNSAYPNLTYGVDKITFISNKKTMFDKLPKKWDEIQIKFIQPTGTPAITRTDILDLMVHAFKFGTTHELELSLSDSTITIRPFKLN